MIANYHTHTTRCNHAVGTEREYIEQAIQNGMQVLGFSDHAPMPFPGDYYSGFRMKLHQTGEYFETLRALQKEYEKEIQILVGLECEYYPAVFERFCDFIEPFSPDYLILGQHGLFNEENSHMSPQPTQDAPLLKQYVDQVTEGLSTGNFLYLAHPDMMNFVGDDKVYTKEMTRLCAFCKENNIPLEINLLGIMGERHYPRKEFWEIASQVGNTAVIGCDAHEPGVLNNSALHKRGEEWAKRFNVPLLTSLPIVTKK